MPYSNTLLAFSAATLLLLVMPGPAVMYVVTRSAAQGRRAGLVSVAGIHLGTVVHVLAAMVGLSAIFFLSFVPQFVDADTKTPAVSIAVLGATFIGLGTMVALGGSRSA